MERDAESVRHLDLPMSGTRDAAGGVESASSRSNRKKATNMFIPAGARHATVITIEAQDRGRAGATTCYIAPFPVWKRGRHIRLRLQYVRSFERYWTEWLSSVPHEENKVIRENEQEVSEAREMFEKCFTNLHLNRDFVMQIWHFSSH